MHLHLRSERVVNDVTQARDYCSSERNFMSGIKSSMALGFAGVAVLYNVFDVKKVTKVDWVFAGVTSVLSLVLLVATCRNYMHAVAGFIVERRRVRNTQTQTVVLLLACALALSINIYEYLKS